MEGFLEITGCFWLTFAAARTVSYSFVKVTPGSHGFSGIARMPSKSSSGKVGEPAGHWRLVIVFWQERDLPLCRSVI